MGRVHPSAADATVTEGSRRCSHCLRAKPLAQFAFLPGRKVYQSWCKTCVRVAVGARYGSPEEVATRKSYRGRPEVRERLRIAEAARAESRRPQKEMYRATPRAKLLTCRRNARAKLRAATDPARIARLESLIGSYTREIDRLADI
jgi:hypothetical protein